MKSMKLSTTSFLFLFLWVNEGAANVKCPTPKEIAKQVINYWVDGLEFDFAKTSCFKKKRYKHLRAKKHEVTPTGLSNDRIFLISDSRPYKILKISEVSEVTHLLQYKVVAEFNEARTGKKVRSSFTFDMNTNSQRDRKVYGCAFHSGLKMKFLRRSCVKDEALKLAVNYSSVFKKKAKK